MWVPIVIWQTNLTFSFPSWRLWTDRKIDDPHPTTSKKYLYHTRAMDRGRSFIHLRSLEARTIQDRLLSEEVEWNGSDYPLASALTLLTSPTLCLLRFLIHVLMSISICMILILQSIYPLVLPVELLSMFFPFREISTKCRISGCTKWSMPLGFPFSSALSGFTDVLWHEKQCTCTLRRPCLRHSSILSPGGASYSFNNAWSIL